MKATLSYAAFRVGVGLVGILPRRVAIALGSLGGWLVGPALRGRWKMAQRHAARLGVAPGQRRRHARRVFAAYGRYWAEAFWVRPHRRAEIEATTSTVGLEHVEEAKRAGRGMIFALPHVGNWEFAGPVAEDLGIELVAVAENLANRRIRDWFVNLRTEMSIGIILAKGPVTRRLTEVLERNGAVALLCDRDLKARGVPVTFFGERTTLPAGPVRLALETGAVLLPVASYFTDDGGHLVRVDPAIPLPEGTDIEHGTQALASALEDLVRHDPGQWHLLQPNWPSDRDAG